MKDCTTCKYGYEDERLGIPMCHHPSRFSEDCVNFNMHEEKEIKEKLEKPSLPSNLDKAAEKYVLTLCNRADKGLRIDTTLESAFKAGAEWMAELLKK